MLDSTVAGAIAQIHDTPPRLVFEFAGAGSLALYWLHAVAGSSRTVLEATDRYATASMADLLGAPPEKFVSAETAAAMAQAAYRRAARLGDGSVPVLGVSCTATIATDRVKKGDHAVFLGVCDSASVRTWGLILAKGDRDRAGEEDIVSRLTVQAIAAAMGLDPGQVPLPLLPGEQIVMTEWADPDPVAALLAGQARSVLVTKDGARRADAPFAGVILSGSFNPLHMGHERLLEAAQSATGLPAAFELPVRNADKPPLQYAEIERRLAAFRWRYDVLLSDAPLFVEKAERFAGSVFVVGYDTAVRLVDPRYYAGEAGRDAALARIRAQGCSFLVAGRASNGMFGTLADVAVPPTFADLFRPLLDFRIDLSSTEIRGRQ